MASEYSGGAPVAPFADGKEAAKALEAVSRNIRETRKRLAVSALVGSDRDLLMPAAVRIATEAGHVADEVDAIEDKPEFGDEASYWTVFRLFCVENNRGLIRNLVQIWDHLALSFDMGKETFESLEEALLEWSDDITADAESKFGVMGRFEAQGAGYVFYELNLPARRVARPSGSRQAPGDITPTAIDAGPASTGAHADVETPGPDTVADEEARQCEDVGLSGRIIAIVEEADASIRQADIVKLILTDNPELEKERIYGQIEEMVGRGQLIKFRPKKNGAAHLALSQEQVWAVPDLDAGDGEFDTEKLVVDINIVSRVLAILTERNRKIGQMTATSQMINRLLGDIPGLTIRQLNAHVRSLAKRGLVTTDMGTPLGGTKEKSRAKSHKVLRVGVGDMKTMALLRDKLASGKLEDLL